MFVMVCALIFCVQNFLLVIEKTLKRVTNYEFLPDIGVHHTGKEFAQGRVEFVCQKWEIECYCKNTEDVYSMGEMNRQNHGIFLALLTQMLMICKIGYTV